MITDFTEKHFNHTLSVGQMAEREIGAILEEKGFKLLHYNNDSKYDILLENKHGKEFKVEVKYDGETWNSGRVAVEYSRKNEDDLSGISVTESDFYAWKIYGMEGHHSYYLIHTKKVKELIENEEYTFETLGGDDNARMYLFPLSVITKHAKVLKQL